MRPVDLLTVFFVAWVLATPAQGWGFHEMAPSLPCEGDVLAAAPAELEPPAPSQRPLPEIQDYRSARDLGGGWADAFYGVGFLQPRSRDGEVWTWEQEIVMPFYDAPGGRALGWLNGGWVEPLGRPEMAVPLSRTGMIETDYEILTFMLHTARDDGWLEIRVTAPEAAASQAGTADTVWVHACRLGQGPVALVPLLWRDAFLDGEMTFFFRQDVPHALRAGPSTESERIAWLVDRDDLEALEIQGDWMRVRAYHPGKYFTLCGSGDPWSGQVLEGWVRWTSPEKGTWIYWPTRGC